jgi:hypothetical protein
MTKREKSDIISGGPATNPRAVVSVSLRLNEHRQVAQAARQRGMKTSEFMREAAVRAASPENYEHRVWPGSATMVTTFYVNAHLSGGVWSAAHQGTSPKEAA